MTKAELVREIEKQAEERSRARGGSARWYTVENSFRRTRSVSREELRAGGWLSQRIYDGNTGAIPALVEYLWGIISEAGQEIYITREFLAYRVRRYLFNRFISRRGKRSWETEEELGQVVVLWAFQRVEEVKSRARAELTGKQHPREGCQEETFRSAVDNAKNIIAQNHGKDIAFSSLNEPVYDDSEGEKIDLLADTTYAPPNGIEEMEEVRV